MKSRPELRFTSSIVKFLLHPEAVGAYVGGHPRPISTHVSPTAKCSLNCSYCSVAGRARREEIPLDVIKRYVLDLQARGLRAVILTGGGEPTMYPQINELLAWLGSRNLRCGLITNGVTTERVDDGLASIFDWVRVSVNTFDGWQERLCVPRGLRRDCVVGLSAVCVGTETGTWASDVSAVADRLNATYIRLLPDCCLPEFDFCRVHRAITSFVSGSDDARFFHQDKRRAAPATAVCHQSFFRPYLSEVGGGTVFPCDSVVLNTDDHKFLRRYALCKAADVLDWLDSKIMAHFDPRKDCTKCVFTENVDTLGFVKDGVTHVDFP